MGHKEFEMSGAVCGIITPINSKRGLVELVGNLFSNPRKNRIFARLFFQVDGFTKLCIKQHL
jgi:hypothetical protein